MSRITGYPIVWAPAASLDLGGFVEHVDSPALDNTLSSNADVLALYTHEPTKPLGRRSARTLTLQRDQPGLCIDLEVSDEVSFARDAIDLIRRGDARGGRRRPVEHSDRERATAAGHSTSTRAVTRSRTQTQGDRQT